MAYKHGIYGEVGKSIVADAPQSETVAVYFGTAPVNLVRGYADAGIINNPVRLRNMRDVQEKIGNSPDWAKYTLCEAFTQHFENTIGNIGPIYAVNVLDPDKHRNDEATIRQLTFVRKRAEFASDTIILDTFAIEGKAEGVDYILSYNYLNGTVVVTDLTGAMTTVSSSFYEVDASLIKPEDIIGEATDNGEYSGIKALLLLYQNENVVANLLAAPGWSHIPEVYNALVSISQRINGHWNAFVNADIPIVDGNVKIDTIDKALEWQTNNSYTSEFSKVYWPQVKDNNGRTFHLSCVATATMMKVDFSNNLIPFESPSNKPIMAVSQYFGENSPNRGLDQQTMNRLNEKGITTAVFWGGRWVLWGPHTAVFSFESGNDIRANYDVNIRMLFYITNNFQLEHGTRIDTPMSQQLIESIINIEQAKLDSLVSVGALIGDPTVKFLEAQNPRSDLVNGDFVWDIAVTATPPFKSGTVRVVYTDEGFAGFFGGGE